MHSKHLSQLATGTKDVSRGNFSWSNSWREPREYLMDSRVVVVVAEDEGVISFRFVEEDGSFVVVFVVVVFFFFGIYMNILFTMGKSLGKNFTFRAGRRGRARDDDDDKVKNTHTHREREDGQRAQLEQRDARGGRRGGGKETAARTTTTKQH